MFNSINWIPELTFDAISLINLLYSAFRTLSAVLIGLLSSNQSVERSY